MFKLKTKFNADSLFYSVSHLECDDHTIHMLTQLCLPPPLTSTMKSPLFTHAHSSPLSLAAKLYQCCANSTCYINIGWTSSGQALFICICVKVKYILYNTHTHVLVYAEKNSRKLYKKMKSVIASRKQKWGLGSERHFIYIPLKLLIFFFFTMLMKYIF